jgi:hypothetical protein
MSNYACCLGVKKKVAAVNSALRGWSDTVFDSLKFPAKVCGPISHNTFQNSCRLFIRLKYVIRDLFYKIMTPFLYDCHSPMQAHN